MSMDPDRARELLARLAPLLEQVLDLAPPDREAWRKARLLLHRVMQDAG